MRQKLIASRLLIASLLGISSAVGPAEVRGDMVVDQEQLNYGAGMSARSLPDYTVWQSFTAGVSGTLAEVDMGFFNAISGDATLRLYAGEGTGGALLQSLDVPIVSKAQAAASWNQWSVDVPVNAGSMYTFEITPNASTIPDPYGVALGTVGSYSGGHLGLNDPSGITLTDFDALFRTFVSPGTPTGIKPFSPSPVPEPLSLTLAGIGALGVFLYARRRRHS